MLADSDTRWKWGASTARRLAPGAAIDGLLLRGRATPTPRQLAEVGVTVDVLREVTTREFLRAAAAPGGYDVIVLACVGGAVQAMLHGLRRATAGTEEGTPTHRPVVVTGYVGVVYEKLTDGLLLRHGADLVLANSAHDTDRFRDVYEGVGAPSDGVLECTLPFLTDARPGPVTPVTTVTPQAGDGHDTPAPRGGHGSLTPRSGAGHDTFTVVFAVQPSVPASREDRGYLLRRAVAHALRNPEREVLIKLRSKPGEHTTHIEELPYQKLVRKLPGGDGADGGLPPNCRLVYGNMGELLDRVRRTGGLLVTVSSTAALESLHRHVPTAVLTDLGVREGLGNHYFTGSGCLASWDELDDGLLPEADPQWALRQGVRGGDGYAAARERVAALASRSARTGLPPLAPYYTARTAPGYLPGILRRYGLGPDGTPVGPTAGPDAADDDGPGAVGAAGRGLLRRVVREAARGAYRHGVQRVAPLIRKAGEL
ncbi:DUF6716 putative glycosyltransferase [Streptomyces reniochalinae]|uniref:Uncharacterized protein n=1 Tax=Streptomyces reniochalinae TaxID=2250578 RepID=A0A367EMH2_9ACTN|nr:DUF6716 putative glycosyltransferase [Streptomyces reniochalinae]RCG19316.1 hypothetical protein DQ392_11675 [Streptomyces reniochalinae]